MDMLLVNNFLPDFLHRIQIQILIPIPIPFL